LMGWTTSMGAPGTGDAFTLVISAATAPAITVSRSVHEPALFKWLTEE